MNKKYSYGDFSGRSFVDISADEFSNSEIIGSCFYQEGSPDSVIFPSGITGVVFRRCNLDNVFVPVTCTVEADCTHRRVKVQNDLEDWEVDAALKPVKPLHSRLFDGLGLSKDPKDISTEKKPVVEEKRAEILALKEKELAVIEEKYKAI